MEAKRPKGFGQFDNLMRKLVKVKPPPKISRSQLAVLRRLMAGWTLDSHGRNGMRGVMVRGKGEQAVVSRKTVSELLGHGMIVPSTTPSVTEFEITAHGKAALSHWDGK